MPRIRAAVLLATSALAVTLVSACGLGGNSSTTASNKQAQGSSISLSAKDVGNLGKVVTDSNGMTLYRFDKDTAEPPASNCDGPCADQWPPLTTTATSARLAGIDKSLIGTIARKDGSVQITLAGWPLYRYAKDTAPGDAKGQGVGNTWYAATPAGKKATASTDSGTDSGGYGY
jgi:predicted lipoprotein with Yx(FWY)xxD motif